MKSRFSEMRREKGVAAFHQGQTQNYKNQLAKLPPQDIEIEQATLGALMIEENALAAVIDQLKPEHFYDNRHKIVYEAIIDLFNKSTQIDILTVTNMLKKKGQLEMVGGSYFITELTDRIASGSNIELYARIIIEKNILRNLISLSQEVQNEAYEDTTDVLDLLDKTEKAIYDISQENLRNDYLPLTDILLQSMNHLEELKNKDDKDFTGIPSGFAELDRLTSGWQKSDLVVVAGRPGMGKTAFVLSCARNAAVLHKMPVAVFSLEMSSVQLVNRLISSETEIEQQKLRRGRLDENEWKQILDKINRLEEAPIFIDDTAGLNIFEFRAKCRRLKAKHNVQLIIVDYLQLMHSRVDNARNFNREQEISAISRSLKQIAKELDLPIIALSQLSREVEKRQGEKNKPKLSDLRESGAIEQDADMVIFLYRAEKYKLDELEDGSSSKGMCQLLLEKNRNGETGEVLVRFVDKYVKFMDFNKYEMGHKDVIHTIKQSKANNFEKDDNVDPQF